MPVLIHGEWVPWGEDDVLDYLRQYGWVERKKDFSFYLSASPFVGEPDEPPEPDWPLRLHIITPDQWFFALHGPGKEYRRQIHYHGNDLGEAVRAYLGALEKLSNNCEAAHGD